MAKKKRKEGFISEAKPRKRRPVRRRGFYFVCPIHGRIPRDEVVFLCNTCDPKKIVGEILVEKGMYICPQCLKPGDNLQCFFCGSTKVEMREYGGEKKS